MAAFTDNQGRTWTVPVHVGTAKRVLEHRKINIFELFHGDAAANLLGNPVLFADVLYLLCLDQCKAQNVTDEDFGRALTGDAYEAAADALLEAVANFSPTRRAELQRKMIAKSKAVAAAALAKAHTAIDEITPESFVPVSN